MALRAVPDHPKFAHLKTILRTPKGATLGWLESVWHFCGKFTQQGNIGKYTDSAIEAWVEWDGEPGQLIGALVESCWLERHARYRLLVHDWHNHADSTTRKFLGRTKLPFLTVSETCTGQVQDMSEICHPKTESALDPQGQGQVAGPGSRYQEQGEKKTPPAQNRGAIESEVPPGLSTLQYARGLLEHCNIPHSYATQQAASSAITAYAKEHKVDLAKATAALIELARSAIERGETVGKFWFEDGKYRGGKGNGTSRNNRGGANDRVYGNLEELRKVAEASGDYEIRPDDSGDAGVLPTPGDPRAHANPVPRRVQDPG